MSKWKDPDFIRVYNRERWRSRNLKRHPNILEDGSLWSESHPYGRFESKEELLENHAKYRKRVPRIECPICGHTYYETQSSRHLASKRHTHALALIKRHLPEFHGEAT